MRYDYDRFDFLIRQETTDGSETDVIYRMPDFVGNLFETPEKKDRKYGAGGRLLEDPSSFYHYDDEGNLIFREFKELQDNAVPHDRKRMEKERGIRCRATGMGWLYEWASNGMLKKVVRPDGRPVDFRYDALGRRTAKRYFGKVTRWVWDGNVPLHEWSYKAIGLQSDEEKNTPPKEPAEDITTWVFEAGTFIPAAKIQGDKQYSIVSDYLGTPIQMYDEQGNKTWDCTLDIYGKVLAVDKGTEFDCPFRFQGQYEDIETGLYYNRFRYYDANIGFYISQDPIGLLGRNPTHYSYVNNLNRLVDPLGLETYFTRLGNFGEEKVMDALNRSGNYTHVFQVQNAANQGIDIVAKTLDGHYDVFEVKTTRGNNSPSLYGDQLDPDEFVQTRLRTAGDNSEAFRLSKEKATEISLNIDKKYLIEVEVGTGAKGRWYVKNMKQKSWEKEAKKIGGYH